MRELFVNEKSNLITVHEASTWKKHNRITF